MKTTDRTYVATTAAKPRPISANELMRAGGGAILICIIGKRDELICTMQ